MLSDMLCYDTIHVHVKDPIPRYDKGRPEEWTAAAAAGRRRTWGEMSASSFVCIQSSTGTECYGVGKIILCSDRIHS